MKSIKEYKETILKNKLPIDLLNVRSFSKEVNSSNVEESFYSRNSRCNKTSFESPLKKII